MHVGAALFEINVFFVIIGVLYITIKPKSRLLSPTLFFSEKNHFFYQLPFFRQDFKPVFVGVFDKINAHRGIFITDATHFLVTGMGGFVVIHLECQMKFVVAEIIGFFAVSEPR